MGEAVTHRIIAVEQGPDGKTAYRTKGDFNQAPDPWNPVTLNEPEQARYVFQVPLLGYLLAALTLRTVRVALIAVPAVLIALSVLWSLWREAGDELAGERVGDVSGESLDGVSHEGVPHDAMSRA
jgi:signal peptidase